MKWTVGLLLAMLLLSGCATTTQYRKPTVVDDELMFAATLGRVDYVQDLLAQGINPNAYHGKDPESFLVFLLIGSQKCLIPELLLKAGADPDLTNSVGWTPLYEVAAYGTVAQAKLLVEYGADVNLRADGGGTPLHNAADSNKKEMCDFLLQNGAHINLEDNDGFTPLDMTAGPLAEWLKSKGAVPGSKQVKSPQPAAANK